MDTLQRIFSNLIRAAERPSIHIREALACCLVLDSFRIFAPKSLAGRISKYVHAGGPLASSVTWVRGCVRSPLKAGGLSSAGGGKISVNIFNM